ncbi:hypothetical protein DSM112329_03639 [Paraconexibacter sp. AEG42_29]|uniref:Uncharacterized protein n=1 Tax=Paraconexibacter sp. AEG42_29 TaxID=2997339 RepID=A0AAU7AYQ9_9ACTN
MTGRPHPIDEFVTVRVIGDPGGNPPDWVKEAWIGIEFDAVRFEGKARIGSSRGRAWFAKTRRGGWSVPADEAVAALAAAGRTEAADWWIATGQVDRFATLIFHAESCVPVETPGPDGVPGNGRPLS